MNVDGRYKGRIVLDATTMVLDAIGEDPSRAGLRETPARVKRSMGELTRGYRDDPSEWMSTFDAEGADQMVCQWMIPTYSLCEHHMLPFTGFTHIGYIPRDHVIGLSKLKRVVDLYARRLQIQERMTRQIAEFLEEHLSPRGVMVVVEAEHLCMTMRGVQAPGTLTTTSAVTGDFMDIQEGSRDEFLTLLGHVKERR
jgi:GTP cyclohydrolase I